MIIVCIGVRHETGSNQHSPGSCRAPRPICGRDVVRQVTAIDEQQTTLARNGGLSLIPREGRGAVASGVHCLCQ